MPLFYKFMKAYIVATLLISTILLSFVDTEVDSASDPITESYVDYSSCGPQTFSSNVKSAFQKESKERKNPKPEVGHVPQTSKMRGQCKG